MTTPSVDYCLKEHCDSSEQQEARLLRRWASDPYGRFDDSGSNFQIVRVSLEFMICRLLNLSSDPRLFEYWCDGVEPVVHNVLQGDYSFAGACILADTESTAQWLAPFELHIAYPHDVEWPSEVSLRIGHRDVDRLFDRSLCCCRQHRMYALSHWIYGSRPSKLESWAINVNLTPYPPKGAA